MQKLKISGVRLDRDDLGLRPLPSKPQCREPDISAGVDDHRLSAGGNDRFVAISKALCRRQGPGIIIRAVDQHDPREIEVETVPAHVDRAEAANADRESSTGG